MILAYSFLETPCGSAVLAGDEAGLRFLTLTDPGREAAALGELKRLFPEAELRLDAVTLEAALAELKEYFAGRRKEFTTPLAPVGTTFQQQVWQALRAIPFGEVRSYAEVARRLGRPNAGRAVGGACGCNPIALFIPCHRVVRADGALGGFGSGVERKQWLLRHEERGDRLILLPGP